ncbi:MAG: PBP1A family penicillin-binding protein [Coriobacteriia bacterium]|nr:PBP1A family penicillin-binding protein [Coriobacteriia bacterium]
MSSHRKRTKQRRKRSQRKIIALEITGALVLSVLLVILMSASAVAATVQHWLKDLPDAGAPGAFDVAEATEIYSADNKLLARLYLENRTVVPLSKISTDLADAIVAIEDERFYQHNGIDIHGLGRAVVVNLRDGFGEEGASTITQQYVRNTILLDEATEISLGRKVREAYLAMELEKRCEKEEILELYLNAIYFGAGAHGAEAASKTYFSKHADELTLAEAALLAGLPQQPLRLDPFQYPDRAVARRNLVLGSMLKNGYITQAEHDEARDTPLELEKTADPEDGIYRAHFYVAHVKKLLQSEFGKDIVFGGGLRVYTTLDTRLQGLAEDAVKSRLPSGPEAALVSLDPSNGYVKALVGGRDYSTNKFNLATQGRRQPGSSFKTFALVTALEEGMPPSYMIDGSSPALIPTRPRPWRVSNSEGSSRGAMSLDAATRASVNTVYARLSWGLGAEKIAATANKMGIESKLEPYPSIALGAQNVTPLEMASAYGTLATNGLHVDPVFVTKIVDSRGKTVYTNQTKGTQALDPSVAYAATKVLKGVITGGTARRAAIGRPAAGKTGTSQSNRDVWFVGYTPQLVTSVWVGYPTERTIIVRGARAFGGTVCAPIWAAFMRPAMADMPVKDFPSQPAPKYSSKRFKNIPSGSVAPDDKEPPIKDPQQPAPTPPTQQPPTPPKPPTPTPPKPPKPDPPEEGGGGDPATPDP